MHISMIAAMAEGNVMGKDNQLPWHLPADLKHFKTTTLGKPVVMGRLTFESIGKPLPGRDNIIVTRNKSFTAEGCQVVHSLEEAFLRLASSPEIMIIGGAKLYTSAMPYAHRLYITHIEAAIEGDTFFPPIDEQVWQESSRETYTADSTNPYAYSFVTYEKRDS